ncbi:subclass B3 metallo-beta-lactamase [Marilutibacter aestuarii]|uniref:beta-lactamase n=1 Tax=Marilutibacter aestuarii TaxID=1706195 RepID=A0A508A9C3_9GAMM|nr:subclass B3 metallo-beta-lactamase [Lysobacter aestuarii]TQD45171.1 subclass B3 metallo-beta-lactamase [Lysobacter aestuarii]
MPSTRSAGPALSRGRTVLAALLALTAWPTLAAEAPLPQLQAYEVREAWRQPIEPFRIAEHTWYIGTQGLSALLVKTDAGAVLIDGGMPQAADMLLEHMATLGVAPGDLKYILHSHAHGDHAGPIAAIQRATGATLVSNAESAVLLARGGSDDIHFGDAIVFPPAHADRLVMDGESIELGGMRFTVHSTPAHTPGSMSWTWSDRRDGRDTAIAYVDSISAPGYRLLDNPRYPRIVDDYRRGFQAIRALPCDLLVTPHPDASGWTPADAGNRLPTPTGCRDYADAAERALDQRIAEQRAAKAGD